jgi:hypothetical protein
MPELAMSTLMQGELMVILWLHTQADPPDPEWDSAVSKLFGLRNARRLSADLIRQLVISDGGAPNALQRKEMADFFYGMPSKLSVVTPVLANPVKRGVATAVTWLNPASRFYEPPEMTQAIAYLDLTSVTSTLEAEFQRLQKQLPPIRTLAAVQF